MTRTLFTLAVGLAVAAPARGQPMTLTQRIDNLRWTGGHLPGAYLQNPGAAGLVWYFSNIGVSAVLKDGQHDAPVRTYLDLYLATATRPGGSINDVHNLMVPVIEWKLADSDDSYAGTILSLASAYAKRPGGQAWFVANLPALQFIATANLLNAIDPPTKLTYTFNTAADRFTNDLPVGVWHAGHAADRQAKMNFARVCQLMDACESYRGLKDFGDRLAALNHPAAGTYLGGAATVAKGVRAMYDPKTRAYRVNTSSAGNRKFYPDRFIQVAPQVYGVDLGPDTQALYDAGWASLNAGNDRWWVGQINDGSNDGAPMMMLGYAAKVRGDHARAAKHLAYFQEKFSAPGTPLGFGNIAELGWALRVSGGR